MEKQEWQKGNDSLLTSLERAELHAIWLKEQHEQVRKAIEDEKPKPTEPEVLLGFID